jgi:hypothetical protein
VTALACEDVAQQSSLVWSGDLGMVRRVTASLWFWQGLRWAPAGLPLMTLWRACTGGLYLVCGVLDHLERGQPLPARRRARAGWHPAVKTPFEAIADLDRVVHEPDESGLDLLAEVDSDTTMLTAAGDAATVRLTLARGALNYLVKPFTASSRTGSWRTRTTAASWPRTGHSARTRSTGRYASCTAATVPPRPRGSRR